MSHSMSLTVNQHVRSSQRIKHLGLEFTTYITELRQSDTMIGLEYCAGTKCLNVRSKMMCGTEYVRRDWR